MANIVVTNNPYSSASNLQGGGLSLQGGISTLQGSSPTLQGSAYNPSGQPFGPTLPYQAASSTASPSATAPATPKQTYVQSKVNQATSAPTQTPAPNYAFYNPTTGVEQNAQGQQLNSPAQNINTGFNGTSGANGTGTYDPYNSPAYQQYLNSTIQAQQSALTNPQIQSGLVNANTELSGLQSIYSNNIQADLQNPGLSQGALTGQEAAEAQVLANKSVPIQTQIDLLNQQQQQATAAAQTGLTSANTQASYLAGLAQPQSLAPGQTLAQLNPSTGQTNYLGTAPLATPYSATTTPYGAVSYNQATGQFGQQYNAFTGGVSGDSSSGGLGITPPTLGGGR